MTRRWEIDYDFELERRRGSGDWVGLIIARAIEDLTEEVRELRKSLATPILRQARLNIMPKTITVGQAATAHLTGTGSDGQPFKLTSTDTVTIAAAVAGDVNFATPVFNADGSVDIVVTGVNADAGDAITATVDGIQSNSDTLTITAPTPTLASVNLTLQ